MASIEMPVQFSGCETCAGKFKGAVGVPGWWCICPERNQDSTWGSGPGIKGVDLVNHPPHYKKGGIECIDYLVAKLSGEELKGYLKGNIIKYLSRAADKADGTKELEDYKKAQWYMNRLVEELSKPK